MQNVAAKTPITIDDLPAEVELQLPAAEKGMGWLVTGIGMVVIAVGVLTLLFGPETIYYNRATGMTFLQMIQAYPGPITTVGFLIAYGGHMLSGSEAQRQHEAVTAAFESKIRIPDEAIPSGYRLAIEPLGGERYSVSLVELSQEELEQKPQDSV